MAAKAPRIVVVGAGIVGASVACHLARRGATVTLVDRGQPAGGVTGRAFAWINVAHGQPVHYARLRHLALDEYRRLERELAPAVRVDWCGALSWSPEPAEVERFVSDHAEWGYDVRLLDRAEVLALEPNLTAPPECAAHAPGEGALDPVSTTRALVAAARDAGADIRTGVEVLGITADDGRVTGVSMVDGFVTADMVVLAAGTGAAALCAPIGVALPVRASPAVLLRFRTPRPLVGRIVSTPAMEVRQASDTILLAAEDYIDNSPENGPRAIAERTLAAIRRDLRGGDGVSIVDAVVGLRPIPADDFPIVGFAAGVAGLYLTVMHAGLVMAPTVGRLATEEILDGREAAALAPCRLERFAGELG